MLAFLRTTCLLIVFVFTLGSQLTGSATIPADRMAVAYQLYSRLVPFGEAARPDWPHDLLLIEDSTITIVPPDRKCDDPQIELNPHVAVQPTRDRRQDYEEILQDFDRHCHDRIILDRSGFKLSHQFRLLGANEQKEFEEYRSNRAQAHDSAIAANTREPEHSLHLVRYISTDTTPLRYFTPQTGAEAFAVMAYGWHSRLIMDSGSPSTGTHRFGSHKPRHSDHELISHENSLAESSVWLHRIVL